MIRKLRSHMPYGMTKKKKFFFKKKERKLLLRKRESFEELV